MVHCGIVMWLKQGMTGGRALAADAEILMQLYCWWWCHAVCRLDKERSRCHWYVNSLSSLVTHRASAADAEFQLHLVQFLFINSFFVVKHKTSDIPCVSDHTRWDRKSGTFVKVCNSCIWCHRLVLHNQNVQFFVRSNAMFWTSPDINTL